MSSFSNPDDRLLRLLCDNATVGISEEEKCELDQLLAEAGMTGESERFEVAAAAMDLASTPPDSELPAELRDKILLGAGQYFRDSNSQDTSNQLEAPKPTAVEKLPASDVLSSSSSRWRFRETLGWLVAAASLVLGLWIWNVKPSDSDSTAQRISVSQLDAASDRVSSDWTNVHGKGVEGKIVWSDDLQSGYMTFENLPANDPSVEQYQLWIFDNDVAQEVPVDGGVFDIVKTEGRSTVVFQPTYPVTRGVQFAITIETPGGVQQSKRERLPVIATIAEPNPGPSNSTDVPANDSVNRSSGEPGRSEVEVASPTLSD